MSISIYFQKSKNATLPEITAYMEYFQSRNFEVYSDYLSYSDFVKKTKIKTDVIFEVKGVGGEIQNKNQILIHDYPSLSTGKLAKTKNLLKRIINPKPDLRIFLNENVKDGFAFEDDVPYLIRDMGIDPSFVEESLVKRKIKYDFIYVGEVTESRNINVLIDSFLNNASSNLVLCLLGNYSESVYDKYNQHENIIFKGRVPYKEVPRYINSSRICINYIPDKYPYNIQTSTKLLEYLCLNKPILTTDYSWVQNFEAENNLNFAKIEYCGFDLDHILEINKHNNFKSKNYMWRSILEDINLAEVVKSHVKRKNN